MDENLESGSRVKELGSTEIDGVADSSNEMMSETEERNLAGRENGTKESWKNNTNAAEEYF